MDPRVQCVQQALFDNLVTPQGFSNFYHSQVAREAPKSPERWRMPSHFNPVVIGKPAVSTQRKNITPYWTPRPLLAPPNIPQVIGNDSKSSKEQWQLLPPFKGIATQTSSSNKESETTTQKKPPAIHGDQASRAEQTLRLSLVPHRSCSLKFVPRRSAPPSLTVPPSNQMVCL